MDNDPVFYDPDAISRISKNRIPHWLQPGATYFVTFRLVDSVPHDAMVAYRRQKQAWLDSHSKPPWPPEIEKLYHQRFTGRFERWLDRGYGCCLLTEPENALIVAGTLQHFEGERSHLHAWVIMPNHVHVLYSLISQSTLSGLLHSWKGFSARQINQRMGKSGQIWQKSYFDRIVRDWDHFIKCARYIQNNPHKAKLAAGTYALGASDRVRRLLA